MIKIAVNNSQHLPPIKWYKFHIFMVIITVTICGWSLKNEKIGAK